MAAPKWRSVTRMPPIVPRARLESSGPTASSVTTRPEPLCFTAQLYQGAGGGATPAGALIAGRVRFCYNRRVAASPPRQDVNDTVLLTSTAKIKELAQEGLLQRVLNRTYNWSRKSSIWPLMFGTACCFIEMAAAAAARYDLSRLDR